MNHHGSLASKCFNALINMVKIESLQITEQCIAKLSWWVSSLSPAKVSGETFLSWEEQEPTFPSEKRIPTEPLSHHKATYNWEFLDTIYHCWNQWKHWSQIQGQKYKILQILKKPSYMQNTSIDLKGGDKLKTVQLLVGIITVHTCISLRDFYGLI